MSDTMIDLRFTGDFSLSTSLSIAEKAAFVDAGGRPNLLDLAFPLDGSWSPVAVRVEQREDGSPVRARVLANPDRAARNDIRGHVERILCLDTDGAGLAGVAGRDKVVANLRTRFRGLRPVLFPSPYHAAARAIIGHRLGVTQAASLTAHVAAEHGTGLDVGGDVGDGVAHAFPAPERLTHLPAVQGLSERKVDQLRALGTAVAKDDGLTSTALRTMDPAQAMARLQELPGIGPFSAELILVRGVGDPDVFPRTEMRLHRAMAAAYGLGDEPDIDTLERAADRWRPYRSWVGLLLRNA